MARRWTLKAIMWSGASLVALAAGLWRWDAAATAVGLVAVTFLLLAYLRRTPLVEVRRSPSRLRVLEGDSFEMGLRVGSRGGWADTVEVYDQLPGYMRLHRGSNHVVMPLYRGEARDASYTVECPLRGAYRIGPLYVRVSDALDLFDQQTSVPDVHQLDVYPVWVELRQLDLTSKSLRYNMGPETINEPGRSTDFYSIRDYIKGDPYKKINWKASARLRKLMINEDERETLSDCAIFVDSRAIAASGLPLLNFHETAVRTTMGLARTLVLNKNRVMVVTYNDAVNVVPSGLSRGHIGIVQAMLVETVARGGVTFDWAVGYAGPFLRPKSDIVVLSPLVSDMSFYPTILTLIRSGHRVVVVTAPLEAYEQRALGTPSPRALLLQMQRRTNVDELTAAGIPVIEVEPEEPLLSIMVRTATALGGEGMDMGALQEAEEPSAAVEGGVEGAAGEGATEGGWLARVSLERLATEAMGLRLGSRGLLLMQLAAMVALVAGCELMFLAKRPFWEAVGADWGTPDYLTTWTFMLLTLEGVLLAWVANLILGPLGVLRRSSPRGDLTILAYILLGFIGLWYLVRTLMQGGDSAVAYYRFVRLVVMIVPFLGALSVLRRTWLGSVVAVGLLFIIVLLEPTPVADSEVAVAAALALVAFVELAYAVWRYESLVGSLEGRADDRGVALLASNMRRYAVVLCATAAVAGAVAVLLLLLPGWYVGNVEPGVPKPLEAVTVYAAAYWFFWLCLLAVVGRWAVLTFAATPQGRALGARLRRSMVLPRGAAPTSAAVARDEAEGVWEEERDSDVPPPARAPV